MIVAANLIGKTQGIFPAPEGGAVLAACQKLLVGGWLKTDEKVLLLITGSGYKYEKLWS